MFDLICLNSGDVVIITEVAPETLSIIGKMNSRILYGK